MSCCSLHLEGIERVHRQSTSPSVCLGVPRQPPRCRVEFLPIVAALLPCAIVGPTLRIMAALSAHAAPFELEESTSGRIAAQNLKVLTLIYESGAANFTEKVKGLFGLPSLSVVNVDKIRLLRSYQHSLARSEWGEFEGSTTRNLRPQCAHRR